MGGEDKSTLKDGLKLVLSGVGNDSVLSLEGLAAVAGAVGKVYEALDECGSAGRYRWLEWVLMREMDKHRRWRPFSLPMLEALEHVAVITVSHLSLLAARSGELGAREAGKNGKDQDAALRDELWTSISRVTSESRHCIHLTYMKKGLTLTLTLILTTGIISINL